MERKRVAGRFVREGWMGGGASRRRQGCGGLRGRVLQDVYTGEGGGGAAGDRGTFVEEAKKGSIAHVKMLTNLGGLDKGEVPVVKKRRGKSGWGGCWRR